MLPIFLFFPCENVLIKQQKVLRLHQSGTTQKPGRKTKGLMDTFIRWNLEMS